MKAKASFLFLAGCLILSGCGGGSGTGTADVGGGNGTVTAGMFVLEGQVKEPQILAAGDGGGNVYGVTGNITLATMRDPSPTSDEGEIVFYTRNLDGRVIMAMAPDGSELRQVCVAANIVNQIFAEPTGSYLYFQANSAIYRVSVRGGVPVLILADVESFGLSPSGTVIAAERNSSNTIVRCTSSGTNVQDISTPASEYAIVSCPRENTAILSLGPGTYTLLLTPGSTPTLKLGIGTNTEFFPDHASGGLFFKEDGDTPGTYDYGTIHLADSGAAHDRKREGYARQLDYIASSPDGKQLIGVEVETDGNIHNLTDTFSISTQIFEGGLVGPVIWTPSVTARSFVGPGTPFASGVGALLFSEVDTSVPSVVFADAVTRASLSLSPVSEQGSTNVIYRIVGDNLNKLAYTRTNGYVLTTVVSAASGLKGALVSFSASTGKITNVITFTNKPTVKRTAAGYEISGEGIESVFDGRGTKKPFAKGGSILIQD